MTANPLEAWQTQLEGSGRQMDLWFAAHVDARRVPALAAALAGGIVMTTVRLVGNAWGHGGRHQPASGIALWPAHGPAFGPCMLLCMQNHTGAPAMAAVMAAERSGRAVLRPLPLAAAAVLHAAAASASATLAAAAALPSLNY